MDCRKNKRYCRLSITRSPIVRHTTNKPAVVPNTLTGTAELSHLSSTATHLLQDCLLDAGAARQQGCAISTHTERARYWRYYIQFTQNIECQHDPFLQSMPPLHRTRLIGAFAAAYRKGQHGNKRGVAEGTIRKALDAVAAEFRENQCPSPIHTGDRGTRLHHSIERQLKGYKNQDPHTKHQKALNTNVYRHIHTKATTEEDTAIAQLLCGAFFFAMRSCEYLTTQGERRTKLLTLSNLRFFLHHKLIPQTSKDLSSADCIVINFEFQKNNERNQSVTMHRTADPILCPVKAWAALAQRILSYPGTGPSTPVNTVCMINGRYTQLQSQCVLLAIRTAITEIGPTTLGYGPMDVGTHSNRSASAMAMYLNGVPVFTIMLLGRWSSDAFLRYIRPQVEQFSSGVSQRMVNTHHFFTIPSSTNLDDPRTPRHPHNFSGRASNSHLGPSRSHITAPHHLHL